MQKEQQSQMRDVQLSPNEIFMSYISSILQDLDADKTNSFSINQMVENVIGTEYKILNKHEQYKFLTSKKISTSYLKYKGSIEFASAIDKYLEDYKNKILAKPIIINGVNVMDASDTLSYFNEDGVNFETMIEHGLKKLTLAITYNFEINKSVLDKINSSDIDLMKKFDARRKVESGKTDYIKKQFNTKINVMKMYYEFIENIDKYTNYSEADILAKHTLANLKSKKIAHDDLGAILYILFKTTTLPFYNNLKCVIIDEAQDLSELMFVALREIFASANFGIFGDVAQGIYSYQSIDDWSQVLNILQDAEMLYLKRSYRTSIEIMTEANKCLTRLGVPPANNVVRHGDEVERIADNSVETFKNVISKCNSQFSHTAIICKDDAELEQAKAKLQDLNLAVIDEHNYTYDDSTNLLLSVQTAKGLEFDSVIIYNESSYTASPLDLKLLYVAETRALHKLVLLGAKQ